MRMIAEVGGRRARRHVVMGPVAVRASDSIVRMRRGSPLFSRVCLFMTLEAYFRSLRGRERLEAENQARLLAARCHVTTRGSVTPLTLLLAMHIRLKLLHVFCMACRTQRVLIHELGIGDLRQIHLHLGVFGFLPSRDTLGPTSVRLAKAEPVSPLWTVARRDPDND